MTEERNHVSPRRFPHWRHLIWTLLPILVIAGVYAPQAWAAARGFYARLTILSTIIRLAREVYVDEVDTDKLMDGAIDGLLDRLDPHSNYLPPEAAERLGERLRGSFGGVGIYYGIIEGVPTVISIIEGGPAEHAGVATGDRIIAVNGQTTLGWREAEVTEHLRGELNTKVTLTLDRVGENAPLQVEIVRGPVPLKSVPFAFMIDDSTGYVRISNFAQTTGQEVGQALAELQRQRMRYLILDLRDNGGGDLNAAVSVANYFLPEGTTIVTQRGRWQQANQSFYASAGPTKLRQPVVVVINHGSASASEIVAGALQDTDRGIIVGQRSFGKGLVQRQFDLSKQVTDGGVLLLTIARYYTPTGRLIQRDYRNGTPQYVLEGLSDESPADTARGPAFYTPLGRVVYGGGGITPDYVIPRSHVGRVVMRLNNRAAFFRFADELVRRGRTFPPTLAALQQQFRVDDTTYDEFIGFARHLDSELAEAQLQSARSELAPYIVAGIAGRQWGLEARYRLLAPTDPELDTARRHLSDASHLLAEATASGR